jgi:hypothetical protein
MTPSGIEPAIFRFVAQYPNNCATISGPQCLQLQKKKLSFKDNSLFGFISPLKHYNGYIRERCRLDPVTVTVLMWNIVRRLEAKLRLFKTKINLNYI